MTDLRLLRRATNPPDPPGPPGPPSDSPQWPPSFPAFDPIYDIIRRARNYYETLYVRPRKNAPPPQRPPADAAELERYRLLSRANAMAARYRRRGGSRSNRSQLPPPPGAEALARELAPLVDELDARRAGGADPPVSRLDEASPAIAHPNAPQTSVGPASGRSGGGGGGSGSGSTRTGSGGGGGGSAGGAAADIRLTTPRYQRHRLDAYVPRAVSDEIRQLRALRTEYARKYIGAGGGSGNEDTARGRSGGGGGGGGRGRSSGLGRQSSSSSRSAREADAAARDPKNVLRQRLEAGQGTPDKLM